MHKRILFSTLCLLILLPYMVLASEVDGTIKIGYVFLDETAGDLSVVQETYNLYEDFTLSKFKLYGSLSPKTYFSLNLSNINLKNRKANFDFRIPGKLNLKAIYDQHRQVFDASRNTVSFRKDARISANVTPLKWLGFDVAYNVQNKNGDRASFPSGVESGLGERYDYLLQTARIEGRAQYGPRVLAVAYELSDYSNKLSSTTDRQGNLVSVRVFTPCFLIDKVTHSFRAAYGTHEISNLQLDYTLANFQYTGEVRPDKRVSLKYNLYLSRIDDEVTDMKTDNIRHNFDGKYRSRYGSLFGGYTYETHDDDRTLTTYNAYRVGGSVTYNGMVDARFRFSNREREDEEKRTLLKDSETESFRGELSLRPIDELTFGGRYANRDRDLPDIDVQINGESYNVFTSFAFRDWGSVRADYTHADNKYVNREGSFKTRNHTVTSRVQIDYIKDLTLAAGVSYIDIEKDLDIEKSLLFFETMYTYHDRYHFEVKYHVYNFDDYVIVDRYYTANVVWINVGYSYGVK